MYRATYYATPPSALDGASTADLRSLYLISDLFVPGAVTLSYVHQERMVIGGACPVKAPVALPADHDGSPLLSRRELGVINIGEAPGVVTVDGVRYDLAPLDTLYVGKGTADVRIEGDTRFYLASTPAHSVHATRLIRHADIAPMQRGEDSACNTRSIYQLIVPEVCPSAQLLMGLTLIAPGSVWNTVPPHLHDRRSEIYFYFGMKPDDRLFHIMGPPSETRHIVVANEEAVICPSWSLHMGVGMSAYAFVWAMGGDNLDYSDMDSVAVRDIQ